MTSGHDLLRRMRYQEDFFASEGFVRINLQNRRTGDKVGQLFCICSVGKSLEIGNPLYVHVFFSHLLLAFIYSRFRVP